MGKSLDSTGGNVSWSVRQGCVWRSEVKAEIDCVPVDLSGATITAVITASATDQDVLKSFLVVVTDAAAGEFYIQIDAVDADLKIGTYWWAMEWDIGDGDEPLNSGYFHVEPWVIQP